MSAKPSVVIGLLGSTLDAGRMQDRWQSWRPTVAICRQPDFVVKRLELLHGIRDKSLARRVAEDIAAVSPETTVRLHDIEFGDPWDFERVYETLFKFARVYPFETDNEEYLVHITTGTHVAQICLFLLTESRYLPGRLLQSSPERDRTAPGTIKIIDLDLSKYDRIASRFHQEQRDAVSYLKGGIETRNAAFNRLMDRIEQVAVATRESSASHGAHRRWQIETCPPHFRVEKTAACRYRRFHRCELRDAAGRWCDVDIVWARKGRLHRRAPRPARRFADRR